MPLTIPVDIAPLTQAVTDEATARAAADTAEATTRANADTSLSAQVALTAVAMAAKSCNFLV